METLSIFGILVLLSVSILIWHGRSRQHKEQQTPLRYDNLEDIKKFKGGTVKFTFQKVEYEGIISSVEYIPYGHGVIITHLLSLQPLNEGPVVPDTPQWFTFTLFMAEVTSKPREMMVNHSLPEGGFGNFFLYRVKTEAEKS